MNDYQTKYLGGFSDTELELVQELEGGKGG